MTEYLIGPARSVNASGGLPGHTPKASHGPFPGGEGAADDEDRVVTADGAQDVGPALAIESGGDRLRAARHGAENDHLTDTVNPQKELGKQGVESGAALLYAPVGDRVSRSLGGRHPGQAELAQITGKCRLCYVPAALEKVLAQIFLAAHHPGVDDLEDGVVSFALVGHGRSLARQW